MRQRTRQRIATAAAAAAIAGSMFAAGRSTAPVPTPAATGPKTYTFAKFDADCKFSHTSSDDPIVFPNLPGASHPHDFYGNTSTKASSNLTTMLAASTLCVKKQDKAGYWHPRLKLSSAYVASKFGGAKFWFSLPEACPEFVCFPNSASMPIHYTYPQDLRIVIGNAKATKESENPLIMSRNMMWNCYPALGNFFTALPNECATAIKNAGKPGGRLDLWVRVPSCWVGKGGDPTWPRNAGGWVIDSPNHFSHMAYPTDAGCPATHPVILPELRIQVQFKPFNGSQFAQSPANGWSSGPYFTVHFDTWFTILPSFTELTVAPMPPT